MQALITVEEAESLIRQNLTTRPVETIPLAEAQGRYLRQDIVADRPMPPFDRVMMDGIAIKHAAYSAGQSHFPIAATQAAGAPAIKLADERSCIEVMTGCVLPVGCDCVIPVELIDTSNHTAQVNDEAKPRRNQHIHFTGGDTAQGQTLLTSGQRLNAPELTIAASCGATDLQVTSLPRILILSTGDEVVAPDETPMPHQIRRSHATALHAVITSMHLGTVTTQHVPDHPETLHETIGNALSSHDVLVVTGGVSRGKYDYVAPVLKAHLGAPHFHGVAQRPGKPFAFWNKPHTPPVFALPGNPVSVMACAARYLLPALIEVASGARATAVSTLPATGHFNCPPHFTGLIPCKVNNGRIELIPISNSGNFLSLSGTHGIAELPGKLARKSLLNEPATFYPWV
ncbi:MAG: molybdopterin molybdotransferase MoeA [Verrucomicrobiae bacterium]|nr:molybdopterin molybdotransferase MoeA [Verrucomicrobiae bacterium]NNJ42751.1 molybdopterin molybdotransferase MoeA [Akkermansiaceae bacterium]